MANNKPPIGRRFQPGQSGNPLGAAAHNKVHKALRRMTKDEIVELGTLLLDSNISAINEIMKDPSSSAARVWLCTIIVNGIKKGDANSLDIILDRIIGRQKNEVELSGNRENPIMIDRASMTEEEMDERIKFLMEQINAEESK